MNRKLPVAVLASIFVGNIIIISTEQVYANNLENKKANAAILSQVMGLNKKNRVSEDFKDRPKEEAKKWADKEFEKWDNIVKKDIKLKEVLDDFYDEYDHIDKYYSMNDLLNRFGKNSLNKVINFTSDFYDIKENVSKLDEAFKLNETIVENGFNLYSVANTSDFNINEKFIFTDGKLDIDKLNNYMGSTKFGIASGFLDGELSLTDKDVGAFGYFKISIPKGTRVVRKGEDSFLLNRNSVIIFDKISLSIVNGRQTPIFNCSLIDADNKMNKIIEEKIKEFDQYTLQKFEIQDSKELFNLVFDGLYAGQTLDKSLDIVKEAFNAIENVDAKVLDKAISIIYNRGGHITISDGNLAQFRPGQEGFDNWIENEDMPGITRKESDGTINLFITTLLNNDNMQGDFPETLIHELGHVIDYGFSTKGDVTSNSEWINCREKETSKLVELLNNKYAENNIEEFFAEAFRAKFNPNKDIRDRFIKDCPLTNAEIDKLFN